MNSDEYFEGKFYFDPNDRIYSEHFPGRPIVPGVFVINAFFKVIKEKFGFKGGLDISGFRFRKFIFPDEYLFKIIIRKDSYKCYLYDSGATCVTGEFIKSET